MADLIDRDAVLEKIETLRKAYMLYEPAGMGGMSAICHCRDIVNEIPTVNRWIPCSERLPDYEMNVLIYCPEFCEQIKMAFWTGYSFFIEREDLIVKPDGYCTHWMPLPEPPEGGAENG